MKSYRSAAQGNRMTNLREFHAIQWMIVAIALMCGSLPVAAETGSSPQDRERFVSIARSLEKSPLETSLREDRKWALAWLTDAPDVTVTVCAAPTAGVVIGDYAYASEILVQYMFSMAARIIEHPEKIQDPVQLQLAGVESALTAYGSILRDKPEAKSAELEGLLEAQTRGELPDFVRKAFENCISKTAEAPSK
jgi:hypothetical protein